MLSLIKHDPVIYDVETSASRQHFIDTGRYLTHEEVAEGRADGSVEFGSWTLPVYAGNQAANYCSNPRINVRILTDPQRCTYPGCGVPIFWDKNEGSWGRYMHSESFVPGHDARQPLQCRYCGCQDPEMVRFRFMSYSDETQCMRCGGVDGRATGD